MKSKPLVSVIIIFWNEETFIREAIESVFAQTYDAWELLLVDDGSTDRSTAIALQYVEHYPGKVRYLEHAGHQNRGMSATRNLGIRHTKGGYTAFLDADDVWFPHTLEEQITILESHSEAALVYGPIQRWYSWTGDPEDIRHDSLRELGVQPDTLVKPPIQFILLLQDKGMPSGMMMRHEAIKRVGGFEEAFRGMYEDNAFLAKICLRESVFASSQCWYRYRKHSNSACSIAVNTGQYRSARLTFLNWVEEYLSKEKVKDNEVWQALQNELRPYRHPVLYRILGRTKDLVQRRAK